MSHTVVIPLKYELTSETMTSWNFLQYIIDVAPTYFINITKDNQRNVHKRKAIKSVQRIVSFTAWADIIHAQFKGNHPAANPYPFTLDIEWHQRRIAGDFITLTCQSSGLLDDHYFMKLIALFAEEASYIFCREITWATTYCVTLFVDNFMYVYSPFNNKSIHFSSYWIK